MKHCIDCRFWSQMIARSTDGRIEALCLAPAGPCKRRYTTERMSCASWRSDHHGKVDDPPNYGEHVRAAYEKEEKANAPPDLLGPG